MKAATLGDVMTKSVVVTTDTTSLDYVRGLMLQHRISRVVIVSEHSEPIGIITDKDLLRFTLTGGINNLNDVIAHEVMSKPLVKESEAALVSSCARRMLESGISSVVVVHGETVAGIVTKTDLCMFYAVNGGTDERVQQRMTARPITVHANQNILDAARIMVGKGISRIPVVNDRLEGIVALADLTAFNPALSSAIILAKSRDPLLIAKAVLPKDAGPTVIGDIMTRNPMTVLDSAYLSDAAKSMITHHVSGLPVLDARNLLDGIVTKTDVTKAVAIMK